MPLPLGLRFVAYKQFSGGMYPTFAFVLAKSIVALPIAIIETAAFGVIIFFMVCPLLPPRARTCGPPF